MNPVIVTSQEPVLLLGGGVVDASDLREALSVCPTVVAADSGARAALAAGRVPDAVIGDFDSLAAADRAALPAERLHRIPEQDTTDFDKCLRSVKAPVLVCLGFSGARLDHELAVYNSLVRHPERRALIVGSHDICFHGASGIELGLPVGSRLSLFPMREVTGRSEGLAWPIDGLTLAPDGRVGTSNRVTGPVRLHFDGPGMLVILPKAAAGRVLEAWGRQTG